jgi:hypothetical protein
MTMTKIMMIVTYGHSFRESRVINNHLSNQAKKAVSKHMRNASPTLTP